MKGVIAVTVAVVLVMVIAVIILYFPGGRNGSVESITVQGNATALVIPSGKVITISLSDAGARAGPMVSESSPIYHFVSYILHVKGTFVITGSWNSLGPTLFVVYGGRYQWMEPLAPNSFSGSLNQTLLPGNYSLTIGGYAGDMVFIDSAVELKSYAPHQVGSFSIPAGTVIHSPTIYSFYLNQSASLVGSFTVGGSFWFSYGNNSSSSSFGSYNSSLKHSLYVFSLNYSPYLNPGYCSVTFSQGIFYVNETMEFIYGFDYSTMP